MRARGEGGDAVSMMLCCEMWSRGRWLASLLQARLQLEHFHHNILISSAFTSRGVLLKRCLRHQDRDSTYLPTPTSQRTSQQTRSLALVRGLAERLTTVPCQSAIPSQSIFSRASHRSACPRRFSRKRACEPRVADLVSASLDQWRGLGCEGDGWGLGEVGDGRRPGQEIRPRPRIPDTVNTSYEAIPTGPMHHSPRTETIRKYANHLTLAQTRFNLIDISTHPSSLGNSPAT